MSFIPRHTQDVPLLSAGIRRLEAQFRDHHGQDLDYSNIWWTPPLSPREAFILERSQIEKELGLPGLVSLTDHDNIEAGIQTESLGAPISVEWTVPMDPVFFHIGLHNIPRTIMPTLQQVTQDPRPERVAQVLSELNSNPETLVVINHPLWDEIRAGKDIHRARLNEFFTLYRPWIHALELNGLRSMKENMEVMRLAESLGLPAVSGGDRHGSEPNANVNVTDAETFPEFAADVRSGRSDIIFMNQYRKSLPLRMMRVICDALHENETSSWNDRVFYQGRKLSEIMGDRAPGVIGQFIAVVRVAEVFL